MTALVLVASLLLEPINAVKKPFGLIVGDMSDAEYSQYIAWLKELRAEGIWYSSAFNFNSFFDMFKTSATCQSFRRYPEGLVDGGKWVCNMERLKSPCVIYSIGSQGNYEFEASVLSFGCEIHTFDCFGDYGETAPPGVTFHKWCVSGRDIPEKNYYTVPTMMKMLGHERVDYLKMDVEGAEYYAIPQLLTLPRKQLPPQLGLEIHPFSEFWHLEVRSAATLRETVNLMLTFHELGYRLVSREDNCLAYCCSEFLYILSGDSDDDCDDPDDHSDDHDKLLK